MIDTLGQIGIFLRKESPTVEQSAKQIAIWVKQLIEEDKRVIPPASSTPKIRTPGKALDDLVLAKPKTIDPEFVKLHRAGILALVNTR